VTVAKWMTRNLITIEEDKPVSLAFHLLLSNDIRHLPVLSKGKLVGIITDRDLKEALIPTDSSKADQRSYHKIQNVKAKKIMTPKPVVISSEAPIDRAAQILLEHKISCLPVKGPKGSLVGILTVTDLLRAFVEFMEVLRGSQRIDIVMDAGEIEKVRLLLQKHGATVISVGITSQDHLGRAVCSFRVKEASLQNVIDLLRMEGYPALPG